MSRGRAASEVADDDLPRRVAARVAVERHDRSVRRHPAADDLAPGVARGADGHQGRARRDRAHRLRLDRDEPRRRAGRPGRVLRDLDRGPGARGCDLRCRQAVDLLRVVRHERPLRERHRRRRDRARGPAERDEQRDHGHDERRGQSLRLLYVHSNLPFPAAPRRRRLRVGPSCSRPLKERSSPASAPRTRSTGPSSAPGRPRRTSDRRRRASRPEAPPGSRRR